MNLNYVFLKPVDLFICPSLYEGHSIKNGTELFIYEQNLIQTSNYVYLTTKIVGNKKPQRR